MAAIFSDSFRAMAPLLTELGRGLLDADATQLNTAGNTLLEAAECFMEFPAGEIMDKEAMPSSELEELYEFFFNLRNMASAAAEINRRTDSFLQGVGVISDELQLGDRCREIAEESRLMLLALSESD